MGNRSEGPGDFIRDLVLYAPLGAILLIREQAEEFLNEAIERGRRQQRQVDAAVNNQMSVAKSVGKRQIKRVIDEVDSRSSEAPFSAVRKVGDVVVKQAQQAASDIVTQTPLSEVAETGEEVIKVAQEQMGSRLARAGRRPGSRIRGLAGLAGEGRSAEGDDSVATTSAVTSLPPTGDSGHLAITDYESLSAAQINARLGGLTEDELRELSEYETSHRGRKTVIARVRQELDSRE
ncbi:MAG: hypothetical protein DCC49_01245 [Acidobacteria bacterium]|nr:MAG: hypothetical protein DCC49_01245 [Acidobacteriota bacterium]